MKKALVCLLIISFLLTLSVNGLAADKKVFAVVPKLVSHPFYKPCAEGVEDAGEEFDVDARFVGPQKADAAKQVSVFENLIVQGVDGIAISPVDANAVKSVIKRAMDKGIPVITFDSDATESERIGYIGTGNKPAGETAGEVMKELLNGKGKIAIMTDQLGAQNLNQRIAGFKEVLEDTDIEIVTLEANDGDMSLALSQAEALLQGYDIDAIFSAAATGGPAAAQVLKAAGKVGDIKIVSFDDLPQTLKYIREGIIYATIAQRPYQMGYLSVEALLKLSEGGEIAEFTDTGVVVVTQENIDTYK